MKRAAAVALAVAAIALGGTSQAATSPDPVGLFAQREARMAARHPEKVHFRGYHYSGLVNGELVQVNGMQVRAWLGKGIWNPCWYLATVGHGVVTGSCAGN